VTERDALKQQVEGVRYARSVRTFSIENEYRYQTVRWRVAGFADGGGGGYMEYLLDHSADVEKVRHYFRDLASPLSVLAVKCVDFDPYDPTTPPGAPGILFPNL
jgi:hypothetical protein